MLKFSQYLTEKFSLTLRYHATLNKKIWKNDKLRDGIRETLLEHAYKFAEFSDVPQGRVIDVIMTGGNCNYNYTKYSDIDVHLVCHVSDMDSDSLYEKKALWTNLHKDLKLAGYPLEFYIENADGSKPKGQGIYSLLHDKWVSVPKHLDSVEVLNDPKVAEKIKGYIAYIKKWLLKRGNEEQILDFKEKMWRMRSAGLERGGEFSVENVAYKDLRNRGLIDALNKRLKELQGSKADII